MYRIPILATSAAIAVGILLSGLTPILPATAAEARTVIRKSASLRNMRAARHHRHGRNHHIKTNAQQDKAPLRAPIPGPSPRRDTHSQAQLADADMLRAEIGNAMRTENSATRVASLDDTAPASPSNAPRITANERQSQERARAANSIDWQRRADCLDWNLQIVIREIAERYGSVLVTSTCRDSEHNRRVGGVKHSQHIGGHAVDFYVYGNVRAARKYLRAHRTVGGLGYYGNGRFHIDNGPHRNW